MQGWALHGDAALGCSLQGKREERGSAIGQHRGEQCAPDISVTLNDWVHGLIPAQRYGGVDVKSPPASC